MSVDSTVIAAVESAVNADQGNIALRLHLVDLLLQADRPADALVHCTHVLALQPDHVHAAERAARAAEAVGDSAKAQSYGKLHAALTSHGAKTMLEDAFEDSEIDWEDDEEEDFTPPDESRARVRVSGSSSRDDGYEWEVEK